MRNIGKISAAIILVVALPCLAQAQTSPNWTYKFVPTPAQWNAIFAGKQDYLGAPPLLSTGGTMTGELVTSPSAAGASGFNLTPGAAPTSPNNGDLWSTSAGFFGQVNGSTVGPFASGTASSFTATSPLAVTFPGGGVVNYAFNFSIANTFLAQQTDQGATTTSPGWYTQVTGDTVPRVRVGLNAIDVASIAFGPGNAARDAFIERLGAGAIRFGAPDVASPVAQSLGVQNVVAGTSNTAGTPLTIAGSRGTGTGAGGNLLFQVAPAGSSGSTQNPLSAALTIFGSDGGLSTGAATDQGAGTLNLAGALYNNGTAPTGTGAYVRATSPSLTTPTLASPTVTGAFTATGLVTLADLVTGSLDTALGYWGSTAVSALAVNNCSNALTYSTSTHAFGCNATAGTGNVVVSGTPTAAQVAIWTNATTIQGKTPAVFQSTSLTPSLGTASAAGVMMGLGATCALTPTYSTRVEIVFRATIQNSNATPSGTGFQVYWGTGTAPVNGVALTGTTVGGIVTAYSAVASAGYPVGEGGIVTGLTAGTAYWFDIAISSPSGNATASATHVTCTIKEI